MLQFFQQMLDFDAAARVTFGGLSLTMMTALIGGLIIAWTYAWTHRNFPKTCGFMSVMTIVPIAVAIVVMLIGRNIAAALGMGGIFVLIRFRSIPLRGNDLSYLFVAICNGIICGSGYVAYGVIFSLFMAVILLCLYGCKWGEHESDMMILKIWIPESLNFPDVFEPILKKYTSACHLIMTRTTDFGSLYEIQYLIRPLPGCNQKEMLDDIRVRNGNMNIVLLVAPSLFYQEKDRMI